MLDKESKFLETVNLNQKLITDHDLSGKQADRDLTSSILDLSRKELTVQDLAKELIILLNQHPLLNNKAIVLWSIDQNKELILIAAQSLSTELKNELTSAAHFLCTNWQLLKTDSTAQQERFRTDIYLEKAGQHRFGLSFWFAAKDSRFKLASPYFKDLFSVISLALLKSAYQTIEYTREQCISQSLSVHEAQHRSLMNAASDGIIINDLHGVIREANNAACESLGYSREEMLSTQIWDIEMSISPQSLQKKWFALQKGPVCYEGRYKRKDGSFFPVEVHLGLFNNADEQLVLAVIRDLSNQKRSEDIIRKLTRAIEQSPVLVMITDKTGVIEYVNAKVLERTGYNANEILGQNSRILQSGQTSIATYIFMWEQLTQGKEWRGELLNKNKQGDYFWVSAIISPLRNDDNETTHYLGVMEDISQKKNYEALLKHQATYDNLTNLPNRFYGYNKLERSIIKAQKNNKRLAILFLDLDEFKQINESLGHSTGDALLKILAERYSSLIRKVDTIVRLGGDEFMLILEDIINAEYAEEIAQKCQELYLHPFSLESEELFISASIGIALFPEHGADAKTLMRKADTAMYQSKIRGRNNWTVFVDTMVEVVTSRIRIKSELHQVLNRDELYLCYQPIISIEDNNVFAAEALLRWNSAALGPVMPDQIIPVAEETGLIVPLGYWILKRVCAQIKEWQLVTTKSLKIAVNISTVQLKQKDFVEQVKLILDESGVLAESLIFEITESAFIDDVKLILSQLNRLNKMNIHCSLDDFGMGYSSLNYIRSYPFKSLKIDRVFIQGIETSNDDLSLVHSIISMSQNLKLKVIAEGIETSKQFELLRSMNCDMVQGWHFSRALSTSDFLLYLNDR